MSSSSNLKRIKKVLDFVSKSRYSSFYRDKYKKAGINLGKAANSWVDFEKLPFLEKDELLACDPHERTYLPKSEIDTIRVTSGTTNQNNPLITFDSSSLSRNYRYSTDNVIQGNVKSILFFKPTLQSNYTLQNLYHSIYSQKKKLKVVIGDQSKLELTAKIASAAEIDAIFTTSSALYYLIPYLKKIYDTSKIKFISLGGEYCSEQKQMLFREVFSKAFIEFRFAISEVGHIGYRCSYLSKKPSRFFHPLPLYYIEPTNPEIGSELIITHLKIVSATPIIRYRTGNNVKLTKNNCRCGQKSLLEVFGRIGFDVIAIQGAQVYTSLVEKALEPFGTYLADPNFKVHVYEVKKDNKIMGLLKLQVVLKSNRGLDKISALLKDGVSDRLYLSSTLTLTDLVQKGVFLPLELEFVDRFSPENKHTNIVSHIV